MKGTVLIIEDEKDLAELIRLYLNNEGLDTVLCRTAEEGLESLGSGKFDLIILDINLPGMDSFKFLQKIRKEHEIPVIIASARESDEDIIFGLGSGTDEFEALQDNLDKSPEQRRLYLEIAGEKADLLQERISDLINYVKMETGEWENHLEKINAADSFNEISREINDECRIRLRSFQFINDIFKSFARGDLGRNSTGFGSGLTIVKTIIKTTEET